MFDVKAPAACNRRRSARPGERSSMGEPSAAAKLCECGCGQPTRIAKADDPRHGHVKGQGVRFLKGHHGRGKPISAEQRAAIAAANSGPGASNWQGDDASYRALHGWLNKHYPRTGVCEKCGRKPSRTHYSLLHGRLYSRNREDYRELCVRCHLRYDRGGVKLSPEAVAKVRAGTRRRWDLDKQAGTIRRIARGDELPQAKLTESAVMDIRRRHAQGIPSAALAREYDVAVRTIRKAVSGATWAHVK